MVEAEGEGDDPALTYGVLKHIPQTQNWIGETVFGFAQKHQAKAPVTAPTK
jgi:hypothetical protein